MMDNYGFYTGKSFDAYEFFGCHTDENGDGVQGVCTGGSPD